ncbi:uncharacterized protein LOC124493988 [Dermatophagoides farinae]|uniref:Uncharacterized protein n=1 Tax=Dermatophagoides farinae TaxID=6954 RepID=A0A922HMA2_DERFA|nr:hypothetical protein DERF_014438 [Dermatophagoides farinae]
MFSTFTMDIIIITLMIMNPLTTEAQKGDPSFMPKIMPITSTVNRTGVQRVYCTANSQTIGQTSTFAVVNNRLYQFIYDMSVIIFEDLDAHYNDDQQRFFLDIGTRYELMEDWEKMLAADMDYIGRYRFIMKNVPDERDWRVTMAMITHPSYGAGFFSYLGFSRYFYLLFVKWDKQPPATSSDVPQSQHIILSNYSIIVSISAETEYFALVLRNDPTNGEDLVFVYHQQINEKSVPKGTFCESETGEQYFHQRKPKDICKTGSQLSQMMREFNFGFTARKNLYLVASEEQYVIVIDIGVLKSYDMEYPYQRYSLDEVFVCTAARSPAIYPTLYPKGARPNIESAEFLNNMESGGGGGGNTWLFTPTVWLIIVSLNFVLVILIGALCLLYVSRRKIRARSGKPGFGSLWSSVSSLSSSSSASGISSRSSFSSSTASSNVGSSFSSRASSGVSSSTASSSVSSAASSGVSSFQSKSNVPGAKGKFFRKKKYSKKKKYRIPTFGRSKLSNASSAQSSVWKSKVGSTASSRVSSSRIPSSAVSSMQSKQGGKKMKWQQSPKKKVKMKKK